LTKKKLFCHGATYEPIPARDPPQTVFIEIRALKNPNIMTALSGVGVHAAGTTGSCEPAIGNPDERPLPSARLPGDQVTNPPGQTLRDAQRVK